MPPGALLNHFGGSSDTASDKLDTFNWRSQYPRGFEVLADLPDPFNVPKAIMLLLW
jgi:hypothetical protein